MQAVRNQAISLEEIGQNLYCFKPQQKTPETYTWKKGGEGMYTKTMLFFNDLYLIREIGKTQWKKE